MALAKCRVILCRTFNQARQAHGLVGRHDVEKTPITAKLWAIRNKAMLDERKGSGEEERVLDKQPQDSRVAITYNLVEDPMLRDLYIDTRGGVLVGKLLEDMDSLAGTVAFIHCADDDSLTPPPQLVTATSEAITLTSGSLSASQNMVMIGQVGYVGRSSLDIVVEVHKQSPSNSIALLDKAAPTLLLSSVFRYVARSRSRPGTAHMVNRLVLGPGATRGEAEFFEQQTAATAARKQGSSSSSSSTSSSTSASLGAQDEAAAKEALALGRVASDLPSLSCTNSIHASRTLVENVFLCQPQHQNTSGKVFGGLLMHRALDVAESCAFIFGGALPELQSVDRVLFKTPVDIGDLVRFGARVVATSQPPSPSNPSSPAQAQAQAKAKAVVEVTAQVVQPALQRSHISNVFTFVFAFGPDLSRPLKRVLPASWEEAVLVTQQERRLRQDA